jgi:hypothetical protein
MRFPPEASREPAADDAVPSSRGQLNLFHGRHIAEQRCQEALDRLDFTAALSDAPADWEPALSAIHAAVASRAARPKDAQKLLSCHDPSWPVWIERAWQRLMGRALDSGRNGETASGEPAAAYLLRGGEVEAAEISVGRFLSRHPCHAVGWRILARIRPMPASARLAFHGGEVLPPLSDLAELAEEDEMLPVPRWLLSYAFIAERLARSELEDALRAEGLFDQPPLPIPGDAVAFAWYLVAEEQTRTSPMPGGISPVAARRALKRISPLVFRRFIAHLT